MTASITTSTLALGLAGVLCSLSPAHAAVPRPGALVAPTASLTRQEYTTIEAKIAAVRSGSDQLSEDPESGTDPLRNALDDLAELGALASLHVDAHDARVDGLLTLARTELSLQNEAEAIAALDEAIRIARGDNLPVKDYGPSLIALHDIRIGASELRPIGSLHVTCARRCRVVLDGRTAGVGTDVMVSGIQLGPHRVDIETDTRDASERLGSWFTLAAAATEKSFAYDPAKPMAATRHNPVDEEPAPLNSGRKLPRWAGIAGMAASGAAMIAGAALVAVNGTCPDGTDPDSETTCMRLLDTLVVGSSVLALGTASLVGFGIAFGIGEKKDRKARGTSAMTVGATFRF